MPRSSRIVLPGIPHHVTQRGSRKLPVFFADRHYRLYIRLLAEQCAAHRLGVWAYCLMPNHVHLIVVPNRPDGLWRPLAAAHQAYAWRVNRAKGWSGHLWQERFASFPMDETHLYSAVRYVLLNPVRAGFVRRPESWPFSSANAHLSGERDELLDPRPMNDLIDDWESYLSATVSRSSAALLRKHARSGRPLGRPSWLQKMAEPEALD